ncbi:hypothetical protein [Xanthovirga aplysinae]|uniref:hypothetical protein n=1 Tax=Xanthovirga aplysinae TaxID=2529853 RepID=UPI0012BD24D0|nr:hypothetical protein [Xanthovirga aplysinae]MTI31459.1 hypothetical protein [Xanthovirga aplysinae]
MTATHIKKRNALINEDFNELYKQARESNPHAKVSVMKIYEELAEKYFLTSTSIRNIIKNY